MGRRLGLEVRGHSGAEVRVFLRDSSVAADAVARERRHTWV